MTPYEHLLGVDDSMPEAQVGPMPKLIQSVRVKLGSGIAIKGPSLALTAYLHSPLDILGADFGSIAKAQDERVEGKSRKLCPPLLRKKIGCSQEGRLTAAIFTREYSGQRI